jgi:tRNA G18 (ribose-2'-O)-methylase SpoU
MTDQDRDEFQNEESMPSSQIERFDRAALRARKIDRSLFKSQPRTPIVIILDGVEGNYNKGAIFRLCDAFMVEHLHLSWEFRVLASTLH